MNVVLETTKFVFEKSRYVDINKDKINDFSKSFKHEHIKHWLNASPYNFGILDDKEKLNFLVIFNSLSFSYWGEPKWTIEYKGKSYTIKP